MIKRLLALRLLILVMLPLVLSEPTQAAEPAPGDRRAQQEFQSGNFKAAYERLRKLTLAPDAPPKQVGPDLRTATQCLERLGRDDEIDAYREAVIKVHRRNWRLLCAAAENYLEVEHYGYIVAGRFERGQRRGGGRAVNSFERDRVRAHATDGAGDTADAQRKRWPRAVGFLSGTVADRARQPGLCRGVAIAVSDRPENAARL